MIVNDLDIGWTFLGPSEADAILLVDPNAVLSPPVAGEGLQAISGWDPQVLQMLGGVQQIELSRRYGPQRSWAGASSSCGIDTVEYVFRTLVRKRPDHSQHDSTDTMLSA